MFRISNLFCCLIFTCFVNTNAQERNSVSSDYTRLFLQQVSDSTALIKWRGDAQHIWFGSNWQNLDTKVNSLPEADHKIAQLSMLKADTEYFYSFGGSNSEMPVFSFRTAPEPGKLPVDGNIHIWLVGDSGTETEQVRGHYAHKGGAPKVRDGFYKYNNHEANDERLDLMLLLGDNAYLEGTDTQWQGAFFDIYPEIIRSTSVWPTIGNHEMGVGPPLNICPYKKLPACENGPVMIRVGGGSESSDPDSYDSDGNGPDSSGLPYLNIFTLPINGEVGGVASGTEQYYSFNFGNLHVISLDSQLSSRDRKLRLEMRDWLISDLLANKMDWTIVIFHHPPYTKGKNHDSDHELAEINMRQTFAPVFEKYGVDVVYSGHAHSYERSWYLRDHHGFSDTFKPELHTLLDPNGLPALGDEARA